MEEREKVIKAIGYDKWKRMGQAEEFGDIPPPECFSYLFYIFLDLFYSCREGITYPDIQAFSEITQRKLTIYEVSLIRRMSSWAAAEINEAWRENT
jgi:hypothetical protein